MKIIAMILAAGFGNRLKPITDKVPKPLIKIGRETILEKHLRNLKKANISKVVINVSHLAEKIIKIHSGLSEGHDCCHAIKSFSEVDWFGANKNLMLWCDLDHASPLIKTLIAENANDSVEVIIMRWPSRC